MSKLPKTKTNKKRKNREDDSLGGVVFASMFPLLSSVFGNMKYKEDQKLQERLRNIDVEDANLIKKESGIDKGLQGAEDILHLTNEELEKQNKILEDIIENYSDSGGSGIGFNKTEAKAIKKLLEKDVSKTAEKTVEKDVTKEVTETASKDAIKTIEEDAVKTTTEDVVKDVSEDTIKDVVKEEVGKSVFKDIAKKIPVAGLLIGGVFAIQRAMKGDFNGAGGELASGALSIEPGWGTAGSVGVDVLLMSRDIYKSVFGAFPEQDSKSKSQFLMIVGMVKDEIADRFKSSDSSSTMVSPNPVTPSSFVADKTYNKITFTADIIKFLSDNGVLLPNTPKSNLTGVQPTDFVDQNVGQNLNNYGSGSVIQASYDTTQTYDTSNIGSADNVKLSPEQIGSADQVISFFMSKGWSKEQAEGIAANLYIESNFKTDAIGDNGAAFGLAQWHSDRQENYKNFKPGQDIHSANLEDQLGFVNYELTSGGESSAGNKLRQASTAADAAAIVDQYYERSSGAARQERMSVAMQFDGTKLNNMSTAQEASDTSQSNITVKSPPQTVAENSNVTPNDPSLHLRLKQTFPSVSA